MSKPYKQPVEIKVNRMVAENTRATIGSILEQNKRYGHVVLSTFDVEALQVFVALMDDKDNRTLEYLRK